MDVLAQNVDVEMTIDLDVYRCECILVWENIGCYIQIEVPTKLFLALCYSVEDDSIFNEYIDATKTLHENIYSYYFEVEFSFSMFTIFE